MKRWIIKAQNIFLVFLLASALNTVVFADDIPVQSESQPPKTEEDLLSSWKAYDGSIHEQAFSSDYHLNGLFSECTEYFNTGDWKISGAALVINYTVTQMLQQEASDLTVSLNGEPVYSTSIPVIGNNAQNLIVPLPAAAIKTDAANSIKIQAYLRGEAVDVCSDDLSSSKWMNIFKESKTLISYKTNVVCDSIAQFYKQFTAIDALENSQSSICLSSTPDTSILTSAASAMTGISGHAVLSYQKLAFSTIKDMNEMLRYKYVIYFSRSDNLLAPIKEQLTAEQLKAAQDGAVCILLKINDCNILTVTGSNTNAMINAGNMLANASYMQQLRGTVKALSTQEQHTIQHQEPQQYLPLTQAGVTLKGSFRQSTDFYIEYPSNRTIAPSSEVSLDFRYSENLDFNRSLVTVFVNNIPIGSKKLEKEKAKQDTISFAFPEDAEISGSFTVKVAFDLEIGDQWCRLSPEEMPWGYVAETSMLKISSTDNARMVFENYPSPFLRDGSMNNTVIVLPDNPGSADLEAMRLVLLTVGRFQKDNAGSLLVTSQSNPGDLSAANIIAIGKIKNNKIALEQAEKLYFKFNAEGSTLLSNDKMLIDSNYGKTLGTAQLIRSPYSKMAHALLVISGATDAGMLKAAGFLGHIDKLWKLSGDGFVADDEKAYCFVFSQDKTKDPTAPVTDSAEASKPAYSFMLVVGAVLLLCLLAISMLIFKYARRKQK